MIEAGLIEEGFDYYSIDRSHDAIRPMIAFVEELEKWNRHINLTGVRNPSSIVTDLLYDTFFLHTVASDFGRIVDLGSGSGIAAVPLAILKRDRMVISVDKSLKKIQFQKHMARMLMLKNLVPVHGRIEEIGCLRADCFHARAFGSITSTLEKAKDHLLPGGTVILPRGGSESAVDVQGFLLLRDIPYTLPSSDRLSRVFLYRMTKDAGENEGP